MPTLCCYVLPFLPQTGFFAQDKGGQWHLILDLMRHTAAILCQVLADPLKQTKCFCKLQNVPRWCLFTVSPGCNVRILLHRMYRCAFYFSLAFMLHSSFVTVFLYFCFDLLTLWPFELVGQLAYVKVASTLMTSTWRDLEKSWESKGTPPMPPPPQEIRPY